MSKHEAHAPHLLIVEARFYDDLADALLDGAKAALDEAARMGFALGEFEECEEDGAAVVEEFYPQEDVQGAAPELAPGMGLELADKIRSKARRLETRGA